MIIPYLVINAMSVINDEYVELAKTIIKPELRDAV